MGIEGGLARRLTTNPCNESAAVFSPDGSTIAFSADYEGSAEVYTMPASGGLPGAATFEGGGGLAPRLAVVLGYSHYNLIISAEVPQHVGKFLADPLTNPPTGALPASQAARMSATLQRALAKAKAIQQS